jgi:UDP-glucose 4-epimerase
MAHTEGYRNRRVLVTGSAGFIGSHLVEALLRQGAHVRALVRYSSRADSGNLEFVPRESRRALEIVRGDIRDPSFMLRVGEGMDVVFHLAALIGIPYSYEAPAEYVATNVVGTLNVLEAARHHHVGRVIHTSTSETYGTAQYRPIDERHPLVAQSPYAASKVGADKLAESYHHSFGLPVVTVRPFNTFGPRQSARAVVPSILSQLTSGRGELRLGSLEPERDLTYVSDTVAGMLALGACDKAVGRTVNLGTGSALSVGDLASKCMAVVGREVSIVVDSARVRPADSEVMALVSDNRQARDLCGWQPRVSVEEGLHACAGFISGHPHLYHPEEYQR